MTIDEMIEVLKAAKEGKAVQCRFNVNDAWSPVDTSDALWNFSKYEYRVKPEPRVVWINEFDGELLKGACFYTSAEVAKELNVSASRQVKFVEVID